MGEEGCLLCDSYERVHDPIIRHMRTRRAFVAHEVGRVVSTVYRAKMYKCTNILASSPFCTW
jgi:hypothetical protein